VLVEHGRRMEVEPVVRDELWRILEQYA
jgi:hypothetical protein